MNKDITKRSAYWKKHSSNNGPDNIWNWNPFFFRLIETIKYVYKIATK